MEFWKRLGGKMVRLVAPPASGGPEMLVDASGADHR
jgi:hypothetical protein